MSTNQPTNPSFQQPTDPPYDATQQLDVSSTMSLPGPVPNPAPAVPDDRTGAAWAASAPSYPGPSYQAPSYPASSYPAGAQWAPPVTPTVVVNTRPRPFTIVFGLVVIGLAVLAAIASVHTVNTLGQGEELIWLGSTLTVTGAVGLLLSRLLRRS